MMGSGEPTGSAGKTGALHRIVDGLNTAVSMLTGQNDEGMTLASR